MNTPTLEHIVCSSGNHAFRLAYWQWGDARAAHVVMCVHGLTRQGRDFDALAQALLAGAQQCGRPALRIICPDMPGRGQSEWLRDASLYQVPVYAGAVLQLLAHLQQQAAITTLDWVGTSMGGLIGMAMTAAQATPAWPSGVPPVHRLVLNDAGPAIRIEAIRRIGDYVADTGHFASEEEALAFLQQRFASFGAHAPEQWRALNRPMLLPHPQGGWRIHYDPAIGKAFYKVDAEAFARGEALAWQIYDAIGAQVLLLRGAESDLLSRAAAMQMQQRGPRAHVVEFDGVGHAPALVVPQQLAVVQDFLLGGDCRRMA